MTNYRRGYDFEARVRTSLENDGYWCIRASGSKGIADLVAIKPGQILLVQVKRTTTGRLDPQERAKLCELAAKLWAEPIVAYQPKVRGPIAYRRLLSAALNDHEDWTTDEVGAA